MKINLRLLFWKKLIQSHSNHPQNFKLISKFSYMRPVFPDYLSASYDYGYTYDYADGWVIKISSLGQFLETRLLFLALNITARGCLYFPTRSSLLGLWSWAPICFYWPWPPICFYWPWPPICIYQPWPPNCAYRPWPELCIYRPWSLICTYQPWHRLWSLICIYESR